MSVFSFSFFGAIHFLESVHSKKKNEISLLWRHKGHKDLSKACGYSTNNCVHLTISSIHRQKSVACSAYLWSLGTQVSCCVNRLLSAEHTEIIITALHQPSTIEMKICLIPFVWQTKPCIFFSFTNISIAIEKTCVKQSGFSIYSLLCDSLTETWKWSFKSRLDVERLSKCWRVARPKKQNKN